jgi:hypothetical protein
VLIRRVLLRSLAAGTAAGALLAVAAGGSRGSGSSGSTGDAARRAGARPAEARAAVERAREAEDDFLRTWLEMHPEEATRLGDHRFDRQLPAPSRADWDREARRLARNQGAPDSADAPADVAELARAALGSTPDAGEIASWSALVHPYAELARLRTALSEPMQAGCPASCTRAMRLASRLRLVPEYLRVLQVELDRGTLSRRAALEAGLDETDALLALCRRSPLSAFDDCREGSVQAVLAEADSQAVRRLEELRDGLRGDLVGRSEDTIEDSARIGDQLGAVAGRGASDAAWRSPAAALARVRAELDALGPAEASANDDSGPGPLGPTAVAAAIDSVRATIVREKLATLRARERVIASSMPALPGEVVPAILWAPGPWERKRAAARLDLGGWPAGPGGPLARDPRRSPAALELCVAREGLPGRALWAFAEARRSSRALQALGLRAVREGWARYVEAIWVERAPAEQRPALERERRALERERLARAAVELMLRVERTPSDSAAAWLAGAAGLAGDEARRAVHLASVAPRFAAGTVAMWGLLELRADLEREMGARFRLGAFHDAVLGAGAVPLDELGEKVRAALLPIAGRKR